MSQFRSMRKELASLEGHHPDYRVKVPVPVVCLPVRPSVHLLVLHPPALLLDLFTFLLTFSHGFCWSKQHPYCAIAFDRTFISSEILGQQLFFCQYFLFFIIKYSAVFWLSLFLVRSSLQTECPSHCLSVVLWSCTWESLWLVVDLGLPSFLEDLYWPFLPSNLLLLFLEVGSYLG